MSLVRVRDRHGRDLVSYRDWLQWRSLTRTLNRFFTPSQIAAALDDPPWRTCDWCWGQRIEFTADLKHYRVCVRCLGVGEIPSLG